MILPVVLMGILAIVVKSDIAEVIGCVYNSTDGACSGEAINCTDMCDGNLNCDDTTTCGTLGLFFALLTRMHNWDECYTVLNQLDIKVSCENDQPDDPCLDFDICSTMCFSNSSLCDGYCMNMGTDLENDYECSDLTSQIENYPGDGECFIHNGLDFMLSCDDPSPSSSEGGGLETTSVIMIVIGGILTCAVGAYGCIKAASKRLWYCAHEFWGQEGSKLWREQVANSAAVLLINFTEYYSTGLLARWEYFMDRSSAHGMKFHRSQGNQTLPDATGPQREKREFNPEQISKRKLYYRLRICSFFYLLLTLSTWLAYSSSCFDKTCVVFYIDTYIPTNMPVVSTLSGGCQSATGSMYITKTLCEEKMDVTTCFDEDSGVDSCTVQTALLGVQQIFSTHWAFAAVLKGGTVMKCSDNYYGGDSSVVQPAFMGADEIYSIRSAFATVLKGSIVVTWVRKGYDGDWNSVQPALLGVDKIYSTHAAFAAVLKGGIMVTWGHNDFGNDWSTVQTVLVVVDWMYSTRSAFAESLKGGTVITWGHKDNGGDSNSE